MLGSANSTLQNDVSGNITIAGNLTPKNNGTHYSLNRTMIIERLQSLQSSYFCSKVFSIFVLPQKAKDRLQWIVQYFYPITFSLEGVSKYRLQLRSE